MKFILSASLTIIMIISTLVRASEPEVVTLHEQIDDALIRFEETPRYDWSFTQTSYENEEGEVTSSVQKYVPSETIVDGWQLVTYNGEKPTSERLKQYHASIHEKFSDDKQTDQDGEQNVRINIRELIDLNSLELIETTESLKTIQFAVTFNDFGIDAQDKLVGTLHFNRRQQFIERILITNKESFSPAFSADIEQFELQFSFTAIKDAILPQEVRMELEGTYAFFAEIKESSLMTFADYIYQPLLTSDTE